jgi:hypothetical protein
MPSKREKQRKESLKDGKEREREEHFSSLAKIAMHSLQRRYLFSIST